MQKTGSVILVFPDQESQHFNVKPALAVVLAHIAYPARSCCNYRYLLPRYFSVSHATKEPKHCKRLLSNL